MHLSDGFGDAIVADDKCGEFFGCVGIGECQGAAAGEGLGGFGDEVAIGFGGADENDNVFAEGRRGEHEVFLGDHGNELVAGFGTNGFVHGITVLGHLLG